MKIELSRHVPPGFDVSKERSFFITGIICAAFYSLVFFIRFSQAKGNLFTYDGSKHILMEGAVMPDFIVLLKGALLGFFVLALCMLGFVIYHYAYHRQGSKSIYLMRRLPGGFELHRRCLTLPLCSVLICFVAAGIMLVLYFCIYMAATPSECLMPHQWQKIWGVSL